MTNIHWKLKNEVTSNGYKTQINSSFNVHKEATTYSAERSQMEDEVIDEFANKTKRNFPSVLFNNTIENELVSHKAFKHLKKIQGRITIPDK